MLRSTAILTILLASFGALAAEDAKPFSSGDFSGLKFREVGPGSTSGRIADFAVDPENPKRYFVAVASGNVWRTENAGTTFEPVFDGEGSYSIGCVTIDPTNSQVIWVGTGENNSQRSVGYGDGVYRSSDGGDSWTNVGLPESEHVGMIVVDPRDGNVVYVAAQGPLWRSGGDRGLYKTTDGGANWERVLHVSDDTGIGEVHMDPRDPDTLYAVAYQRRRHQWVLLDGGPESGIHKSTDGGATWSEINGGLPGVDKGRIGMTISPVDPDVLYAVVEAQDGKGGFFRSNDRGASWAKRSDFVAGSPQYYNELFADPVDVDRVYAVDTFFRVTEDGGENFERVPINFKHVDDHAVWIDPTDTEHLLVGCDGGIYETWDRGANWNWKANLPITQFYKIAIDDDVPFYWVYGGTQDNNTLGGPTRNSSSNGMTNADWLFVLSGDGFEPAVEPGNPDIVYAQAQYGELNRFDRRSGEYMDIKPQGEAGQILKWHWSSALLISPHSPTRLYYGAQVLFRSEDRGDNWTQISPDLTRQLDRNALEVMGRVWSVDAVAKNASTSYWGCLVSFTESPLAEGVLYAGSDDGVISISEDNGANWRKELKFDKVPEMSYVSFLEASRHDANVVFAAFDNHKMGDFKPYLLRSDDRGRRWKSIAGDLPERGNVQVVRQDPVDPQLLFVGTEFGVFFTKDGGAHWTQLEAGIPTIGCYDLEIQPGMDDLVVGTFGRGAFVLDDYGPLRAVTSESMKSQDMLFAPREAWLYIESQPLGWPGKAFFGDSLWQAQNPPYGAVFTYYLAKGRESLEDARRDAEKKVQKDGGDNPYPSWDDLRAEDREIDPTMLLTVRDGDGNVVRRISGPTGKGFQRVAWNLRHAAPNPASKTPFRAPAPWVTAPKGPLVTPGIYTVTLEERVRGVTTQIGESQSFEVKWLPNETLLNDDVAGTLSFQQDAWELQRQVMAASRVMDETQERIDHVRVALRDTPGATSAMSDALDALNLELDDLRMQLDGDATRGRRSEPTAAAISDRIGRVLAGWDTRMKPTGTQRQSHQIALQQFATLKAALQDLSEVRLREMEAELESMGAPWTPGRGLGGGD